MYDLMDALEQLMVSLHVSYFCAQDGHWNSKGGSFVGDHKLFNKIMKARLEDIDQVGEVMTFLGKSPRPSMGHAGQIQEETLRVDDQAAKSIARDHAAFLMFRQMIATEQLIDTINDEVMPAFGPDAMGGSRFNVPIENIVADIASRNLNDLYKLKQRVS